MTNLYEKDAWESKNEEVFTSDNVFIAEKVQDDGVFENKTYLEDFQAGSEFQGKGVKNFTREQESVSDCLIKELYEIVRKQDDEINRLRVIEINCGYGAEAIHNANTKLNVLHNKNNYLREQLDVLSTKVNELTQRVVSLESTIEGSFNDFQQVSLQQIKITNGLANGIKDLWGVVDKLCNKMDAYEHSAGQIYPNAFKSINNRLDEIVKQMDNLHSYDLAQRVNYLPNPYTPPAMPFYPGGVGRTYSMSTGSNNDEFVKEQIAAQEYFENWLKIKQGE